MHDTGRPSRPAVTVILPTLGEARRRSSLVRAIESVSRQGCSIPLVVINGNRYDPSLADELRRRSDIRLLFQERANLAGAIQTGRQAVDTEYFAFLDDDDEYLPQAFARRLQVMSQRRDVDVAISNGLREQAGEHEVVIADLKQVAADPMAGMLRSNWLASCAGLYRSSSFGEALFALPDYFEWTYLAFSLCLERKQLEFFDESVFIVHDTAGSQSKSEHCRVAHADVLERLLALDLPTRIRRGVREKYGSALHTLADHCRMRGKYRDAWLYHLRSLVQPKGMRYALFTRKLLCVPNSRKSA